MRRWLTALIGALSVVAVFAGEELPQQDEGEGLEIEPPLLIQSRGRDGLRVVPASAQAIDLAKLEADLARARRNAAAGDRLFRAGIIAKVEAEERALRVVRLEATLAEARLAEARERSGAAEQPSTERASSAAAIAEAEQNARRAAEERHRAELEAALRNLERQQKLLALGSGRKADVNRAEKKLADLQGAQN